MGHQNQKGLLNYLAGYHFWLDTLGTLLDFRSCRNPALSEADKFSEFNIKWYFQGKDFVYHRYIGLLRQKQKFEKYPH